MSIVDKALWIVERNSGRGLSLPGIAEACGVSRAHLASAFGSATGVPLIKYLRARRLSVAADALAAGAPDILDVALDAGYGSHEAFTRAFREQFGTTPERVRNEGNGALAQVPPLDLPARRAHTLDPPCLAEAGPIRAVGLSRRHLFDAVIGIPIQWQDFMTRHAGIPHCSDDIPIGVVSPADEDGGFEYTCAAEVSAFGALPAGLVRLELPPRRYAVFEHRAHVSTIFDTYATIWNDALPAHAWTPADAPAIERHRPSFDPGTGEGGLSIWIPLADLPLRRTSIPESAPAS